MVGEFSVKPLGGIASRAGGFFQRIENSDVMASPVFGDVGHKSSGAFDAENTSYASRAVSASCGIRKICHVVCGSKVREPVVSGIAVNVVENRRDRRAITQQPRQSVAQKAAAIDEDAQIAIRHRVTGRRAGISCVPSPPFLRVLEILLWPGEPAERSAGWFVIQNVADVVIRREREDSHNE